MSVTPPFATMVPQSSQPINKSAGKAITPSRKINFSFLLKEGFQIGELIKTMSWEFLCNLDLPSYPALMNEFYNTLAIGENR